MSVSEISAFRRSIRSAVGRPLAYQVADGFGAALRPMLERVIRGERVHDAEIRDMFARGASDEIRTMSKAGIFPGGPGQRATAVVSVRGVALYDVEAQPYAFSTLHLAQTVDRLANDPQVGAIALDIDSPGGVVTGTPEAGDAIFRARQRKKVTAVINPLAASAAYWIASQATEIIAVPSADVGSIGVFMMHADCSEMMKGLGVKPTFVFAGKHKVEGNSFEPLGEEAKAHYQGEVDKIYSAFLQAVARGRRVSVATVEARFGQGRTIMAPEAKQLGMVDAIATVTDALRQAAATVSRAAEARSRRLNFLLSDVDASTAAAARRRRLDALTA